MLRAQGFLFALPALLLLAIFIVYPMISTVLMSVTDASGGFTGLENYTSMVTSSTTSRAFTNTIFYVGLSIIFQMALGTAVGIVLNETFWGRALVRSLMLIPWLIPGIVAAMTWAWMFNTDFGIINYALMQLGVIAHPVGWLTNPSTVLPALTAVNIWKMFPFVSIMVLAGLQAIPVSLYEAARVDGANWWHEIRYITLPGLKTILSSITLLLLIAGVNSITIIYATTKGGPADRSLITSIQIYVEAFQHFDFNRSSALSVMFFLITTVFIVAYIRNSSRQQLG
ncbi:carbohydrate ABC transporter permease [Chelatococcus sp. GCM10030263]|uniref:carbohydrate ABC transporter permease n=1 Tax=Chelatococcus sp. GCM10030263 TaxID=3273387 RepID=UPI003611C202